MWRFGGRRKDDGVSGAAATNLWENNGYKLFGWDLEWQHYLKDRTPVESVDEMTKEIETRLETGNTFTKDNIVILIHNEMFKKNGKKVN